MNILAALAVVLVYLVLHFVSNRIPLWLDRAMNILAALAVVLIEIVSAIFKFGFYILIAGACVAYLFG